MSHETISASKGEFHDKVFESETVRSHFLKNVRNGLTASRLMAEKKKKEKKKTIGKFQILSCLVANAVTTVFHTDTKNKDIWLWSQWDQIPLRVVSPFWT